MQKRKSRKVYSMVFLVLITGIMLTLLSTIMVQAASSGSHTPVTGVMVAVSGATDNSMSNGAVTVTAEGSGGIFGWGASAKTATITITNNSGSNATVSFNWTATSVNELKIDGNKYTNASGSFSKQLDADAKITITITTAKNGTTNKLVLNNFKVVKAGQTYTGTFIFDSSLGSVTVDSNAISNGGTASIKTEGTPIIANPKSGVTFLAWIDANTHERISVKASDTLVIDSDRMIRAVFVNSSSNAWFIVGGSYYYDNLNDALAQVGKVGTVSDKTIVVASNGTLPTGNYTIPSGVTLLIPFDDANTLYTNRPGTVEIPSGEKLVNTTPYRTLTMADGANITVNGAISVSGKVSSSQPYNGVTSGPAGFINMNKGSSVTVNTNGKFYAWGYIQGDGTVTIKSNGVVYECFQVRDFRGGTATSGMIGNDQEVFPMSQYYIQNIQVPMTIEAGAKEYAYFAATLTAIGTQPAEIPFIGENAMFNITSGYLVKDYDEQSDRLIVNVFGNVTVKSFEFSIKLGLFGTATIKSEEYKLPLTSHMTVNVNSGKLSISQDIAMLPESVLYIAEGAQCVLTDKSELIVYDFDNWGKYCYPSATMCAWPYASVSRTIAKDATVKVDGTLDATNGYLYTTAGGANIYSTGSGKIIIGTSGTDTKTNQATQSGTDISYVDISITPAKLQNADGSYTQSTKGTYKYVDGVWTCQHVDDNTDNKCDNCLGTMCEHKYALESHTWAPDFSSCVGSFICDKCHKYSTTITLENVSTNILKEPTCTESGSATYTVVFEGGQLAEKYTVKQENVTLAPLGHTVGEWIAEVSAENCMATGTKAHYTCATCHKYLDTDKQTEITDLVIPAKGKHNVDAWAGDQNETQHTRKCFDCGEIVGDPENHTWNNGKCSVCQYGCEHDYSVMSDSLATAAGCENNALYFAKCSKCGAISNEEKLEQADTKTGHTYGNLVLEFGEDGKTYTVTVTCAKCPDTTANHSKSEQRKSETVRTIQATCLEKSQGIYKAEGTFEGSSYSQSTTIIGDFADHSYGTWIDEIAATCEDIGTLGHYHCSVCLANFDKEKVKLEDLTIVALGHKDSATDEDHVCDNADCDKIMNDCSGGTATCKDKAVCEICGQPYGNPAEHTPGEDDGDCTTAIKCTVCGTETAPANEKHSPGADDGDCTTAVKCVNCEQNAIEAKAEHVGGQDDGDCTTAVKCANCDQIATPAKDAHVAGEDDGDCTTPVKCANCEQNAIAANAEHVGGTATCKDKAVCEICGQSYGVYANCVDKDNDNSCDICTNPICEHTDKLYVEAKVATCTEKGNLEHWICQSETCGRYYLDEECTMLTTAEGVVVDEKEHDYSEDLCDREFAWKKCSACTATTERVARKYTVTVIDYLGNETVKYDLVYNAVLDLEHSASEESMIFSWVVDGQPVSAEQVWGAFEIDAKTVLLTVKEAAYKPGKIQMAVDYTGADSEKTMTVDLFISVESLAEEQKPIVKLGGKTLKLKQIHESIMMYFVSIQFSAKEITQGGDNTKIEINYVYYDGDDTVDKTINSILIAYELALSNYIGDDKADATKQETAIEAVLNYGKAVQIYFAEGNYNWAYQAYDDTVINSLANSQTPDRESVQVGDIKFTWVGANVQFKEAYSLRYEFEMTGLPDGVTPASAKIVVTDKNGTLLGEYTDPTIDVKRDTTHHFYAMYPVPASDIAKEDTVVKMVITLSDGTTVIETPEFKYGMRAYLTYSIHHFTKEIDPATGKVYTVGGETNQDTREKTNQYVQMLVSLLKLGETMLELESAS